MLTQNEQKITTEKRKQALVKARQVKKVNGKKQKHEQLNKEKSASKIQKTVSKTTHRKK